jgi:hypothetical protein
MKAEEEEVDIDSLVEDAAHRNTRLDRSHTEDEDIAWADREVDKDLGDFKLKITIHEDSEL